MTYKRDSAPVLTKYNDRDVLKSDRRPFLLDWRPNSSEPDALNGANTIVRFDPMSVSNHTISVRISLPAFSCVQTMRYVFISKH